MSDLNSVTISGHLTRDSELRYTAGGTPVLNIAVAFNKSRKDANGQWVEKAGYIDGTIFGKRAESLAERLVKGVFVIMTGELEYSQWERDGRKNSKISVIVDGFKFNERNPSQAQTQDQDAGYYDQDIDF